MKRRIGILTSGGDCPGLNAAIRGVTRAAYELFDAEIVGIHDGYRGLITGDYQEMKRSQFSGILTLGGTILGTARTPFRDMRKIGEDNVDKVAAMKKTYKDLKLDCLVTLGGNGTHKTANLLSKEGLNVIGLPKTIDNDLYGTDFTFGFHTAMDIATEVIDRIHTTAASHGRCMVVEIMGNKAGWLTLYSGVAGGADAILIPEIPYKIEKVAKVVESRAKSNKGFTIIAVAEGAMTPEEDGQEGTRSQARGGTFLVQRVCSAAASRPRGRGSACGCAGSHPARRQPECLRPRAVHAVRRPRGGTYPRRRVRRNRGAEGQRNHPQQALRHCRRAEAGSAGQHDDYDRPEHRHLVR